MIVNLLLLALAISLASNIASWRISHRTVRQHELILESYHGLASHADETIKSLQEALIALERDRNECAARAEDYFKSISSAVVQRNEWQQMYYQHAIEHGNAQAMLLAEVVRLAKIARATGAKFQLTPGLSEVVGEFYEHHADPASAAAPEHKLTPLPDTSALTEAP